MKNNSNMKIPLFLIFAVILPLFANAEDTAVIVRSRIEPESAVGLLISSSGTVEKNETKISRNDNGDIIVSFPIQKNEASPGTLASAIVKGKDGSFAFAEMSVLKSVDDLQSSEICKEEEHVPPAMLGQLGLLQALVQKRAQRREIGKEKIKLMLTEPMIKKFQQFEQVFGISEPAELDVNASPYDLIKRLSRLEAAIRTYKANNEYKLQVKHAMEAATPPK
jgi:hypothetical protein